MSALPLLVWPEWLEAQLGAPDLRLVDASWYLPDAARDARAEHAALHLPGAVYLDLGSDLADPDSPVRNSVAPPERLAEAFAAAGISNSDRVVVYDRKGGYSAGRVWWTLRYAGHSDAALLDGGLERWIREGRATSDHAEPPAPGVFRARAEPRWLASRHDVLRALSDGSAQIVDARSAARFRGEGVEPAKRPGHIPGSHNVPYDANLHGDPPTLKPAEALRAVYEQAGISLERPVITSCGSGVTASLSAFALHLLGHDAVSVYDGSWAEWGNTDDLPVETGP